VAGDGLTWKPMDDKRAEATLTDGPPLCRSSSGSTRATWSNSIHPAGSWR